ncbi:MAG TPA: hypothetical protein VGF06_13090 [Terriglobales bacterium]
MSRIRCIATLLLLLGSSVSVFAQKLSGQYAVIVNPRNTAVNITSSQLRKLALGEEKFWAGRVPVTLILQDERSVEHDYLLRVLLNMSSADYREHWSALVFRGVAVAEPTSVPSNGLASGLVAVQDGAICIMRADNVPRNDTVKVLKVDGKLPGEAGYPLHE